MDNARAPASRLVTILFVALSLVVSLYVAGKAMAAPAPVADTSHLVSQYAAWAGGKGNAAALVTGLRNASSITLVTTGPDRTVSIAGFTPRAPLAPEEVAGALSAAKATLARLGITRPSADEIQAALIGGEVTLPSGRTRLVQGSVPLANEPVASPIANR